MPGRGVEAEQEALPPRAHPERLLEVVGGELAGLGELAIATISRDSTREPRVERVVVGAGWARADPRASAMPVPASTRQEWRE